MSSDALKYNLNASRPDDPDQDAHALVNGKDQYTTYTT